ncbi:MAG TPA: hypothetical protein VFZ11_01765 [Gemmatimonadaceae bacterium]
MAAIAMLGAFAACDSPLAPEPHPVAPLAVAPTEDHALAISANIRALHLPHGTIVDPVFASSDPASPDYSRVVGYSRAGDAAIWTGHYLAAEAIRWRVTGDPDALDNARAALDGIRGLVEVTGNGLLARFALPVTSPWVESVTAEEGAKHGRYEGTVGGEPYYWFGNTSRDQYSGVFFGLAIAHDAIDDDAVRAEIRAVVSRMLDFLLRNGWNVRMPDGSYSTTFLQRPDQQLAFLQIGRRVNRARYGLLYLAHRSVLGTQVRTPIQAECLDTHGSYYKFNLDHINLFNLVRLEPAASPYRAVYAEAFALLRSPQCTGTHPNAHFRTLERGLTGNAALDAPIASHLADWLERPRRDYYIDHRGNPEYPPCGEDRSCVPIAIEEQVNTDFLWQRSPFLLYGGGDGTRETAGIDYILPYWMARFYGIAGLDAAALAAAEVEP